MTESRLVPPYSSSRCGVGSPGFRALKIRGLAIFVALSLGCTGEESNDVDKIGRYEFHEIAGGLEIRESSTGLSRFLDALFGRTSHVKIRLGAFAGGASDVAPTAVGEVVVRKRRLKGPATKPNASRRPFEVRLLDHESQELSPFFYFGSEVEARSFATRFSKLLTAEN